MSIIALVVMWLAMNLIIWLTYNPSLIDLANFFLPLTLLPLLASAYAEVNQEGQRLLKVCIHLVVCTYSHHSQPGRYKPRPPSDITESFHQSRHFPHAAHVLACTRALHISVDIGL